MLVVATVNLSGLAAGEVTDVNGNDQAIRRLVDGGYLRRADPAEQRAYKETHGDASAGYQTVAPEATDPARVARAEQPSGDPED